MKHIKLGVIALLLFGMVIVLTGIMCADQPVPAVPETQTLSTTTTADVVGLAMETDAGAWTTTNGGLTMVILNYVGTQEPNYLDNAAYSQLIAAGGSATFIPGQPGYYTSLSIPESLLNQPFATNPALTWSDYVSLDTQDGYSQTITHAGIHTGALNPGQIQYTTAYDANIVAQAGHTIFTKSMNIDTRNKVISQSNLDAKTGLTFAATADGGNVVGSENLMLDGAGMNTVHQTGCSVRFQPTRLI